MPKIKNILPYGFKSFEKMSSNEIEIIQSALGISGNTLSSYVSDNLEDKKTIDFHSLNCVDSVFHRLFENGQDITPIVSIVDWSQFTFSTHRFFEKIFQQDKWYDHARGKGAYHVDNMTILWKNFLDYRSDDKRYRQEQDHTALWDFGLYIMATYAYTFHPNHKLPNHDLIGEDNAENRVASLISKRQKLIFLFQEIFEENKNYYTSLSDNKYFSRVCMEFIAKGLSASRGCIPIKDSLFQIPQPYFENHFSYLWSDLSFVVTSHLFQDSLMDTPALDYIDSLVKKVPRQDFAKNLKANFISYQQLEKNPFIYHFLFKSWDVLAPDDFNTIFFAICERMEPINNPFWNNCFKTVEPIDQALTLFKKHAYKNKSVNKKLFDETISLFEKRLFSQTLEQSLQPKQSSNKIKKI